MQQIFKKSIWLPNYKVRERTIKREKKQKIVNALEGVHCSVIEHSMTSLSFQTAVQKNEAKLSSVVHFENEMASYRAP